MNKNVRKQGKKQIKTNLMRCCRPDSGSVDLTTRIKDVVFRNPLTVASGTFGTKDEYAPFVDIERLGAVITKTITVKPRRGNPMPRICEAAAGMLNAIGLQNKGLQDFIEDKIPYFEKKDVPLIVNIAGESTDEFRMLVSTLTKYRHVVKAIELNLSCPNVEKGGVSAMRKRDVILDIVRTARSETDLLLIAKLSPELGDLIEIAGELVSIGIDALSLINTLKGMAVDVRKRCSKMAKITGGLSGPAIKPVALRYVYEVKKKYKIPVIASGGIMTAIDALEFLVVGADLVAVGTANFVQPTATLDILDGIKEFCVQNHIACLDDLRGSFKENRPAA